MENAREGEMGAQVSIPELFGFLALNPSHVGQGRGGSLTFRDFRSAGFL